MHDLEIEKMVKNTFDNIKKEMVLDFIYFLKENEMEFERGKGYWKNQYYYMVKYKDNYVCFILLNGTGDEQSCRPLTIWSDDSGSKWYEDFPLSKQESELVWKHVDYCVNCGACAGGRNKRILGKDFDNVCRTTLRFINPDKEVLNLIKKLVTIRKNDILKKNNSY